MPIEFSRQWRSFVLNPEVGYMAASRGGDEWWYGLILAREFNGGANELLFELHGRSMLASSDRELFFNLGTRLQIKEWLSLIASAGHTWWTYRDEAATTFTYFGMQLRL
jgi:hypothetical protein